jgi:hypothetical protein
MMDFCSPNAFSKKEVDNSMNFAAGGITNGRKHHNSLCRDKNKH